MLRHFDLILLRHAQAYHNVEKRQLRQQNKLKKGQKGSQFHNLKLDLKFKDQHITQNGYKQCKEVAQTLDWNSIDLIIVSPLRRCLDTCRQIMKQSKKNIHVIVEPSITGMVTNAWSLGSSKSQLQNQYPQFNFTRLNDNGKIPWYLKTLCPLKIRKINELKNHTEMLQNGIKQDPYQFRYRVQRFGKILQHYLCQLKPNSRILIISHNKVFSMMTAKIFNQKGKGVSDLHFNNADINYVPSWKCFSPLMPSL